MADKMGVQCLVKTMNMVLLKHIKLELPVIRESIIFMLETKKNKIAEYGQYDNCKDKKAQGILILSLVNKYVKFFIELIEGRSINSKDCVVGGARIEYIFSQVFIKSINKLNPFEFLTDTDIRTAIRNANGLRRSLFLPEMAF
jgi:dynamin 1-like protein